MTTLRSSTSSTETTFGQTRVGEADGSAASTSHVVVSDRGSSAVERPRRDLLGHRGVRVGLALVVPLTLLVAWHLLTTVTGTFAPYQLPSPTAVVDAGVELATRANGPTLWLHVAISVQRVLIGFAAGALAGLVVGAVVGLSRVGDALLSGTIGALRAVPSLGWVPLLILWIGINEDSKVLLIAIGAFFPVYTTVASALRHVDAHLVEAGRAYGFRGTRLLTRVQLPAATPAVVAGLRLALAQSWLFLVAAELIAASMGLGFLLTDSANNGRVDRILLALVVLAVLGKTTDALIGVAERRLLRRF
ncbi:ABC transporter permease [Cellulomonas carbonis]|uniref:Nitrate ABC transporter permease n=1 Tax=Cellulomonas carbonis T26 TaxID=947969 RepID=A0A0A0BVJ7_9CELL|nr:ABC transporter permease [Cellulomonas carbonis]KGM12005.1 nitrate ABC transporter permease [Cellulomonas carbonis T26]GGB98318.1 ABC transporter permease [Cellulomonas carbonis]